MYGQHVIEDEEQPGQLDAAVPPLPGGVGGRLPLAGGKAVLRVDYGWSRYGSGLYLDFGQAF